MSLEFVSPGLLQVSQPAVLNRGTGDKAPGQAKESRPRAIEVGFSFGAG
jgi:hypothetical protein